MKKMKVYFKTFAVYVGVLTIVLLIVAFPKDIYANNNENHIPTQNEHVGKGFEDRKKKEGWKTSELKAIISSDKRISFTWTAPSDTSNIVGYNLYRGTASGRQSNTPITDFPIEGLSYTDENLDSGTTYYYVLKAVYKDKTLGTISNEVVVLLKSRVNLYIKAEENGVNLYWTKPSDTSNIIGYNLYRGMASGKETSTPITDFPIEMTSYTDENIENNSTYYYILKVVYKDKTLGAASNEVTIKYSPYSKNVVYLLPFL